MHLNKIERKAFYVDDNMSLQSWMLLELFGWPSADVKLDLFDDLICW